MAFLSFIRAQFGKSATPANNIVLRAPDAPDGSLIVSKGTYDAPGATLATFNADGSVSPAAVLASTENSQKVATTGWAKFGFAVLLSGTGYIKFPSWMGGLIIQWGGTFVGSNTPVGVTWPLVYPAGCLGCLATVQGGAPTSGTALGCQTSTTGMNLHNTSGASNTLFWLSFGY